jgi:hypothetical protein
LPSISLTEFFFLFKKSTSIGQLLGTSRNQWVTLLLQKKTLRPVCFVGNEFHFNNYNLDKTN